MLPFHYREEVPDQQQYLIVNIPLENRTISIKGSHYRFDKKIGKGAFGAVYASRRYPDNMPVAIKVVSLATKDFSVAAANAKSVLKEFEMSRHLSQRSNHMIHMYAFDFHETGLSFLVMELGQQDLEKYLSQRAYLLPNERKSIWRQLVEIAVTLYQSQIVHRDIKPQNLIVFPNGIVKLADLGIAQQAYLDKTGPGGTIFYSAPEVTSPHHTAKITSKADAWSWGAVLYRMTYMTHPGYGEPCFYSPNNQRPTRDLQLRGVLRRTLVMNPIKRVNPLWLAGHPYTTFN
ncbi:hypothetical protein I4U23_023691 [Adineta vaga]|nr:hypothetical protein I4U23_023691 [Adineta vaga]